MEQSIYIQVHVRLFFHGEVGFTIAGIRSWYVCVVCVTLLVLSSVQAFTIVADRVGTLAVKSTPFNFIMFDFRF